MLLPSASCCSCANSSFAGHEERKGRHQSASAQNRLFLRSRDFLAMLIHARKCKENDNNNNDTPFFMHASKGQKVGLVEVGLATAVPARNRYTSMSKKSRDCVNYGTDDSLVIQECCRSPCPDVCEPSSSLDFTKVYTPISTCYPTTMVEIT